MSDMTGILLIVALAVATYATRVGGHIILSRFDRLNPRIEAALDAVPAAVMTAIVAPMALAGGAADAIASGVVLVASLRLSITSVLVIGVAVVLTLRAMGL